MESPAAAPSHMPHSSKDLATQAENFTFNVNIAFKHYTRTAETLRREAVFATNDGDYGRAYVMLYRYSVLVLRCLPTHPQFKNADNRKLFKPLSKGLNDVLNELEAIKPTVDAEYAKWQSQPVVKHQAEEGETTTTSLGYADLAARDPSLAGNARILDASKNQDLAVDLAQAVLTRRDAARYAAQDRQTTDQRASSALEHPISALESRDDQTSDLYDLQKQMAQARIALNSNHTSLRGQTDISARSTASTEYRYPSVTKPKPLVFERDAPPCPVQPARSVPKRPPKEEIPARSSPTMSHSSIDMRRENTPHIHLDQQRLADHSEHGRISHASHSDYSLQGPALPKKERLAFKPGAYLENGDPIRSVFIPSKLRFDFLQIAKRNTQEELEMCGILCGTPINNALFVRCLLIPDQKCTSDTCETENEGAIFDYCAKEDLLVLGWIHTHPTQTCFMSSRDLHTHAGYQVMMLESIAIVCAPLYEPSYGIFRLTHPPGLDHVLECKQQGTFHPHSMPNIYRETEHPHGHVYESDKMPFYVHDLRRKRVMN